MAVTDSRMAGALRPTSSDNETELMDPLRQWISELIGLRLDLVRASWRPKPGTQPALKTDWCALALKSLDTTPVYLDGRKGDPSLPLTGDQTSVVHEDYEFVLSFYGSRALFLAQRFRDAAQIGQNRSLLRQSGLTLKAIDSQAMRLPDFVCETWVDRYDMTFHVARKVSRTYGVRTIVGADVDFYTERGKL